MESTSWTWRFASPQAASALGEHPEQLLENAELIKMNPVRKVFRTQGYYLKQDLRHGHHLQREWNSGELVVARGIPCVDYLALGRSAECELLISRAVENSMTVSQYICEMMTQPDYGEAGHKALLAFAESLAEFSLKIIEAKLVHTDYHLGNILYVPAEKRFCLVDTCGIRRKNLFDIFSRWRMEKVVLEFSAGLSQDEILHLYEIEKSSNPLRSYKRGLKENARHLCHSWKKRSKQILAGHHRYTMVFDDNWLKVVDAKEHPLEYQDYDVQNGAPFVHAQLLRAHFIMEALAIPHLRIYAFNRHTGELHMEKLGAVQPCTHIPDDYLIRLNCLGIKPCPEEWRVTADGRTLLVDFKQVCSLEGRWSR